MLKKKNNFKDLFEKTVKVFNWFKLEAFWTIKACAGVTEDEIGVLMDPFANPCCMTFDFPLLSTFFSTFPLSSLFRPFQLHFILSLYLPFSFRPSFISFFLHQPSSILQPFFIDDSPQIKPRWLDWSTRARKQQPLIISVARPFTLAFKNRDVIGGRSAQERDRKTSIISEYFRDRSAINREASDYYFGSAVEKKCITPAQVVSSGAGKKSVGVFSIRSRGDWLLAE